MAYLFAKVIAVFDYATDPDKMDSESRFWSLMWVVFAVGSGASYFCMGLISTRVSYVSYPPLREREPSPSCVLHVS